LLQKGREPKGSFKGFNDRNKAGSWLLNTQVVQISEGRRRKWGRSRKKTSV